MSEPYDASGTSRSARLDRILAELVSQVPEIEAASVVSFDGLPMASALPDTMDEDRVAAMSAALLSLGERAAEGLGRGELSQVYVEGENGTVFLISADDEAVLVAVAARHAKIGLMLFEVRRAAAALAEALRVDPLPVGGLTPVDALAEDFVTGPTFEPTFAPTLEPSLGPAPEPALEHRADAPPLQVVSRNGWSDHQTGSLPATDWR